MFHLPAIVLTNGVPRFLLNSLNAGNPRNGFSRF
jgi:hypothetical protein